MTARRNPQPRPSKRSERRHARLVALLVAEVQGNPDGPLGRALRPSIEALNLFAVSPEVGRILAMIGQSRPRSAPWVRKRPGRRRPHWRRR